MCTHELKVAGREIKLELIHFIALEIETEDLQLSNLWHINCQKQVTNSGVARERRGKWCGKDEGAERV